MTPQMQQAQHAMAAVTGFFMLGAMMSAALFGLWIFTIVDIAKSDFKDQNSKTIWLLLVLFLGPIGLMLYWLIGRTQKAGKAISPIQQVKIKRPPKVESGIKFCGNCGREMKVKKKLTGADEGKQFWVCSGFPECKTYENYEDVVWF